MSDLTNQLHAMAAGHNEQRIALDRAGHTIDDLESVIQRAAAALLKCDAVAWQGDIADAAEAVVSEVARLRLTDAEREALRHVRGVCAAAAAVALECGRPDEPCVKLFAAIDGLLERHAP